MKPRKQPFLIALGIALGFAGMTGVASADPCVAYCLTKAGKNKIGQKDIPLTADFSGGPLCKKYVEAQAKAKCKSTEGVSGSFGGTYLTLRKPK